MADMATLVTAIGSLAVAVGALVVSVGVFYLVVRVGQAIELLAGSDRRNDRDNS